MTYTAFLMRENGISRICTRSQEKRWTPESILLDTVR